MPIRGRLRCFWFRPVHKSTSLSDCFVRKADSEAGHSVILIYRPAQVCRPPSWHLLGFAVNPFTDVPKLTARPFACSCQCWVCLAGREDADL